MSDTTELPPAGWHDDPTSPGQLRFWDGMQWTHQVQAAAAPASQVPLAPQHTGAQAATSVSESDRMSTLARVFACVTGVGLAMIVTTPLMLAAIGAGFASAFSSSSFF